MNRTALLIALTLAPALVAADDAKVPGNWRRSDPLSAIYLPTTESKNDRCNQQVVGIVSKSGAYVVSWTMASEEGKPDQRVVVCRSADAGQTWSPPQPIDGHTVEYPGAASYSWLFQVPKSGRIYCFYLKNDPAVVTVRRDVTGWLKWQYSDDDGVTWNRVKTRFDMGRGEWTPDDPKVPTSWIGIYSPHVTSRGDVLFAFARYGLKEAGSRGYGNWMTEVYFLRLDNVLTEPDPEKLSFTIVPQQPRGLRIKRAEGMYWGNEPSWIELSDGRIVLFFYNAKQAGTFGPRNPIWIAVGREDLHARQPVRFAEPVKFMEVADTPPLGSTYLQIASYSSVVEHNGKLLLFYNDCKHWVLFKHVPERLILPP